MPSSDAPKIRAEISIVEGVWVVTIHNGEHTETGRSVTRSTLETMERPGSISCVRTEVLSRLIRKSADISGVLIGCFSLSINLGPRQRLFVHTDCGFVVGYAN
jgi:hypothetical protein